MKIFNLPALDLVLALAPYPLTIMNKTQALVLINRGVDWDDFIFWVKRHGVIGSVMLNMDAVGREQFPSSIFQQMKRLHVQASIHSAKLISALANLNDLFCVSPVNFYSLKGPILSHVLYNSFNLRASFDLDLIVHQQFLQKADEILRQANYVRYEPAFTFSPLQERVFSRYRHHFSYHAPEHQFPIELHWSLAEPYYLSAEISQKWMQRGMTVKVPGLQVKTLSREDFLIYAFVHGAKHRWSSIKHLLDVQAVLDLHEDLDWDQIVAAIHEARLERAVGLGLTLLQLVFEREIPLALRPFCKRTAVLDFLTSFSLRSLASRQRETPDDLRWGLYGLLLKPGPAFFFHYLSKFFFTPADWRTLRLPDVLFPLYFLLHPFLWLWRKLRGIQSKV